jgi:hypothetical protein
MTLCKSICPADPAAAASDKQAKRCAVLMECLNVLVPGIMPQEVSIALAGLTRAAHVRPLHPPNPHAQTAYTQGIQSCNPYAAVIVSIELLTHPHRSPLRLLEAHWQLTPQQHTCRSRASSLTHGQPLIPLPTALSQHLVCTVHATRHKSVVCNICRGLEA